MHALSQTDYIRRIEYVLLVVANLLLTLAHSSSQSVTHSFGCHRRRCRVVVVGFCILTYNNSSHKNPTQKRRFAFSTYLLPTYDSDPASSTDAKVLLWAKRTESPPTRHPSFVRSKPGVGGHFPSKINPQYSTEQHRTAQHSTQFPSFVTAPKSPLRRFRVGERFIPRPGPACLPSRLFSSKIIQT
ncbi:hypothetical protein LZ31DRAFT_234203 [Colletotrichum somersetense]|nr:hypothetical protein LZ31DRAFT_234203 [Colletotrichum somersetense]